MRNVGLNHMLVWTIKMIPSNQTKLDFSVKLNEVQP